MLALVLALVLLLLVLSACGSADAKAAYKPPARVFDVEIEGTSEPKIDGVEITYDSKARVDTVSYAVDGYDYKQEYSYDTEQIVIKTIYKTEVIEEKTIKYVEIPVTSGFAEVDGYIVRVTEDMPIWDDNNESDSDTDAGTESNDQNETTAPNNDSNDENPQTQESDKQTFTKEEYGWSIELADGWSVSFEDDNGYGIYGSTFFGSSDNVGEEGFNIYAVVLGSEKDDKEKGAYFAAPDCGYLGENSEYAFYWSITGLSAQGPDIQTPNLIDTVRAMLKTFKLS